MFTTIYATFKLSTPNHFYIHIIIPATTLLITTKLSTKYISHTNMPPVIHILYSYINTLPYWNIHSLPFPYNTTGSIF